MKKILIILATLVALCSCNKDNLTPTPVSASAPNSAIHLSSNSFSYNWHGDYGYFYNFKAWYFVVNVSDGNVGSCEFAIKNPETNVSAVFTCYYPLLTEYYYSNRVGFTAKKATVRFSSSDLSKNEYYFDCTVKYSTTSKGASVSIQGDDWNVQSYPR